MASKIITSLKRTLGFVGQDDEHTLRGYGTIHTGFFEYITPKMLLTIIGPALLITFNFELVSTYFMAAYKLNMVIVAVFTVAMLKATYNNWMVYKNARYLKMMGEIIDAGRPSITDIQMLLSTLGTKGNLFDTNHMEGCISNIERFGHPNFRDNDARMIKSKLGQRIGEARKTVFFLGGLLVMLGLIGTYMGLLLTIDRVGNVMQQISAVNGNDGGDLSGFLGALAEPLQGMGLAFSSSLFGISGSLLTQVYANFCTQAQSEFIENVSRWIDDRIPKFSSADKDQKNKVFGKAASADDLRTWLAGFVNLSVQSNRKLSQLIAVMLKSGQASIRSSRAIDALLLSQKNTNGMIEAMSQSVVEINRRPAIDPGLQQMVADMSDLKSSAREISGAVPALTQALNVMYTNSNASNNAIKEGLVGMGQTIRNQAGDIASLNTSLQALPDMLSQMMQTQNLLLERLENMQSGTPSNPVRTAEDDAEDDLAKMLAEMGAEDTSATMFEQMFGMMGDDEPAPENPVTTKQAAAQTNTDNQDEEDKA